MENKVEKSNKDVNVEKKNLFTNGNNTHTIYDTVDNKNIVYSEDNDKKIEKLINPKLEKKENEDTEDQLFNTKDDTECLEILNNQDYIEVKDSTGIIIKGSEKQKAEMFLDMSKYFEEVTNPDNNADNPYFKSKYANLAEVLNHVRPAMGKYGLSIIQAPFVEYNVYDTDSNGKSSTASHDLITLQTMLMHKSGGYMVFPPLSGKPAKRDIQGVGSIITYLRRFSLNSIAGTAGEVDDDGISAAGKKKKTQAKTKKAISAQTDPLKAELISACANYADNDSKKRKEIIEALKEVEENGNVNKITKKEDIKKALNIVVGLM